MLCRGMTDLSHRVKSFYQKRLLPAEMVSSPRIMHLAHTFTPRTYTTHTAVEAGPAGVEPASSV